MMEFYGSLSVYQEKSLQKQSLEPELLKFSKSILQALYDALFFYQMLDDAESTFLDDPLFTKQKVLEFSKTGGIAVGGHFLPGFGILVKIYEKIIRKSEAFRDKMKAAVNDSERFEVYINALDTIQDEFGDTEGSFNELLVLCGEHEQTCTTLVEKF